MTLASMWQTISSDIANTLQLDFIISDTQKLTGGDINLAYKVSSSNNTYFVKINKKQFHECFLSEAFSLDHLSQNSSLIVPKVITSGQTNDCSYLVLEFIDMHTSGNNQGEFYQLGQSLALLHSANQQAEFGWPEDNFIGSTKQLNDYQEQWSIFFAQNRINYQLKLLAQKGIELVDIESFSQLCQQLLAHHHPIPTLVHGDLWQGNIAFSNHIPCLFDPACYYGDREVDIAMSELFGRFPESFYKGYQASYPLQEGYLQRRHIYNGYHMLNHANLFGGIYIDQAKTFIKEIQKLS